MTSLTQWTWTWANSRTWGQTEMPGVLQSVGLQRVRHDLIWQLKNNNREGKKRAQCFKLERRVKAKKFIPYIHILPCSVLPHNFHHWPRQDTEVQRWCLREAEKFSFSLWGSLGNGMDDKNTRRPSSSESRMFLPDLTAIQLIHPTLAPIQ